MRKKESFQRFFAVISALVMGILLFNGYAPIKEESVSAAVSPAFHVGNRTRVDLNANDGRKDSYTYNAYNWIVTGTEPQASFNGLSFKLSKGSSVGSGIRSANNKRLTKSDGNTPTLTMDGVTVNDADKGGIIKLEVTGLPPGIHTLTTWHSYFDNWQNGSPITVSVNGEKSNTINVPTQVDNDENAGKSFTTFNATEKVTVLIEPTDINKNGAVLNAFEIDGADPFKSISNITPKDGDNHHEVSKGLSWTAGIDAKSHDIYIGRDFNNVYNASKASEEFKGNQTATSFALDDSYSSLNTYYWRVDEVGSSGIVKGAVHSFQPARLAFPTAEGYGRFARGGQCGRIIEVTNLNDSGIGSLRHAIEVEKGSRIIVFRVGGVIELKSRLVIPNDGGEIYVAGQTAPGDGITLINYDFGVLGASDVIIRHIRVRPGDYSNDSIGGMGMASANNCIIDHCSMSWATDEGFSSRGSKNISFQWNIIGETLNNSVHHMGKPHSFAASISGYVGSFHHNLLVNNTGRNWSLAGGMEQDAITYGGNLDIRNNVVYNWRDRTTDGGVRRLNFVNNFYKAGAVSNTNMHMVSIDGNELNTYDMQMMYVFGNKMLDKNGKVILDSSDDAWAKGSSGGAIAGKWGTVNQIRSNTPFFESYVNTQSADDAYKSVTTKVGAGSGVKSQGWDYIDSRYIKEVTNGTFTYTGSKDGLKGIIDSQRDVGGYPNSTNFKGGTAPIDTDKDGMPDAWEIEHGLNPNDAKDGILTTLSADGYTNVEMYLNELAGDPVVYNGKPEEPLELLNGNLIKNLVIYDDRINATNWSIQNNLQVGDFIYGDRMNTFTTIPDIVMGAEWIKLAADSKFSQKEVAEFTAGADILAYVALDSRVVATNLNWISDWENTGIVAKASNDVDYILYRKGFNSGEKVLLGTNGPTASVIMYSVFVTEVLTEPLMGDVNKDGIVDEKNIKSLKEYLLGKVDTLPNAEVADMNRDGIISSIDLAILKYEVLY